jgi:hypothetical protein
LAIINEFEQVFSSSFRLSCLTSLSFSSISTLSSASLGSDTAHVVVRGVSEPLLGMVIDRFEGFGGGGFDDRICQCHGDFPQAGIARSMRTSRCYLKLLRIATIQKG